MTLELKNTAHNWVFFEELAYQYSVARDRICALESHKTRKDDALKQLIATSLQDGTNIFTLANRIYPYFSGKLIRHLNQLAEDILALKSADAYDEYAKKINSYAERIKT